jgi:hypothetical protein
MRLYECKQTDLVHLDGQELHITDCNPYLGYIEADSRNPWERHRFEGEQLMQECIIIEDEPQFTLPKSYQKKWWQIWKKGVQA